LFPNLLHLAAGKSFKNTILLFYATIQNITVARAIVIFFCLGHKRGTAIK
jgi:hypothetical protein